MTEKVTFLLLGESNAGGFNSLTPPQTYTNVSRIHKMGPSLTVESASDPLVVGSGFHVGPGMAWADKNLSRSSTDKEICIMTGIGLHAGADWQENSLSYLVTVRAALKAEAIWGPVKAILWVQGINDVTVGDLNGPLGNTSTLLSWPMNVRRTFSNIRTMLRNTVPIVVATLPANPHGTADAEWDRQQAQVRDLPRDVEKLAVIECVDLAVNSTSDQVHWTAASQVSVGHRADDAHAVLEG